MQKNNRIAYLKELFSSYNYVMTTAELTKSKVYYADIKQLLDEELIAIDEKALDRMLELAK